MNPYGQMAMRHWRTYRPVQYALIPNPREFFRRLGEQIREQTADLAAHLADPSRTGDSLLAHVERLTTARLAAYRQAIGQSHADAPGL
jgi:hypothetical protein